MLTTLPKPSLFYELLQTLKKFWFLKFRTINPGTKTLFPVIPLGQFLRPKKNPDLGLLNLDELAFHIYRQFFRT